MNQGLPTPQELDAQNPIKIERWIDLDTEEWREMDDDPGLTKKMMKIGFEAGALFLDSNGRIWGKGEGGKYYPFHFDRGPKNYGYRLPKKAAN